MADSISLILAILLDRPHDRDAISQYIMELTEDLDIINKRLLEYFGKAWNNYPIWRVVWSDDQFEKRLMAVTDSGIALLYPEMREVPKYSLYIKERYILERLVAIPPSQAAEIAEAISYEPVWTFEDRFGNYLPPKWEAAKMVVDSILAAIGKESLGPKYIDPEKDQPEEHRKARIEALEKSLFGNETDTGDALAHKQAVIVPRNYIKESKEIH